jgi:hypothetical protein
MPGVEASESSASRPSGLPSASSGTIPSISLPKGGGSISGMGEKFEVSSANGTGSITMPISTSPSRGALDPALSLSYNSGNGNGPFGLGWDVSLATITRKTALGIPKYQDGDDSDVFMISGAEDLVPVFKRDERGDIVVNAESGIPLIHEDFRDGHVIRRYSPRIEGSFLRIERWTGTTLAHSVHWRVITPGNVTSIYGKDKNSQIHDPSNEAHVFSWLLAEQFDTYGNAIIYRYKEEDSKDVNLDQANERNRSDKTRSSNRYLSVVRYGNKTPNRDVDSWAATSAFNIPQNDWMFSIAFDYGEYDEQRPNLNPSKSWKCRKDPFSSYRSGL